MSAPRLQAAVFDLDGTLCDSAPDIRASLNAVLGREGIAPLSLDGVVALIGGGARRLVERAVFDAGRAAEPERISALLSAFLEHYAAHPCVETRLYPGAREALDALRSRGLKLAVCTNKPEIITARVLDGLEISHLFECVVGGSDRLPLKPEAAMLRACLTGLGAIPPHAVMVGDSEADAGAARAAGVRCVLLAHGYAHRPLAGMGADAVIPGFAALGEALGLA